MDINDFDPFEFAKEIENEPFHVIDLTGDEPVEYISLPTPVGPVKYTEPKTVRGLTYQDWMKLVNREIILIAGVGGDDIGDWDSHAAWSDGSTPSEGAHEALEANDFPFEGE